MSVNGSQPHRRLRAAPASRRARLAIGASAALLIGAVLVAPVVLLSGGTSGAKSCARTLLYQDRRYVARPVAPDAAVEAVAIGVGVENGCGASPSNVDLRSLVGVKPAAAVGLPADDTSIYVRRGLCPGSSESDLVACLSRG